MDNKEEFNSLIAAFKGYRDLLTPVQTHLRELVETYDLMQDDLKKLDESIGGGDKLDKIYQTIVEQNRRSGELTAKIQEFVDVSDRYMAYMTAFGDTFAKIENKLAEIDQIEQKALNQLARLDKLTEEKKINYDVRDLEKTIDGYNENVKKVSDFINKDVAASLADNGKKIETIRVNSESMARTVSGESENVEKLLTTFAATNALLKSLIEKGDVYKEYLYDLLDGWANQRRVKIKK